jgi:hypothetical protein
MGKIEINFKEDGSISITTDNCSVSQLLCASKVLEVKATQTLASASEMSVDSLILGLEMMLIPFGDETKDNFDQNHALKSLPISLKMLVDKYKEKSDNK